MSEMAPGKAESHTLLRPASLQEDITIAEPEKEMNCNMQYAQCLICWHQHHVPLASIEWKLTCLRLLYLAQGLKGEPNIDGLINMVEQLAATYECDTELHKNFPLQAKAWFANKFLPETSLVLGGVSSHANQ